MTRNDIAKICHEVNRAYCEALGDKSQLPWDEAPEWQRSSAIHGVEFHLANPDSKPSDSHDSWMREKLNSGWKFGAVKDPENKRHPCILPFNTLPVEQQAKDFLFLAVVRSLEPFIDL